MQPDDGAQSTLATFIDIPEPERVAAKDLRARFDDLPLVIDEHGVVRIRGPFCPECGSRRTSKAGIVPKQTFDLLGDPIYLECQQYVCTTCPQAGRPPNRFSANVRRIIVYDEESTMQRVLLQAEEMTRAGVHRGGRLAQLGLDLVSLYDCLVRNHLHVNTAPAGRFTGDQVIDLATRAVMSTSCMENTRNLLGVDPAAGSHPSADTALLYLGRKTMDEIRSEFRDVFRSVTQHCRRAGLLGGAVDVAVDFHDVAYYGKRRDQNVSGGKGKAGTNHFHKYITVDSVDASARVTLFADHIGQFDDNARRCTGALDWVQRNGVEIRHAYLDREFFNRKVIDYLVEEEIPFVMPAVKNKTIMQLAREHRSRGTMAFEFRFGSAKDKEKGNEEKLSKPFTVVISENPEARTEDALRKKKQGKTGPPEFFVFATNLAITLDGDDPRPPGERPPTREEIREMYRRRWGIETDYRVVVEEFWAKTTSNNFRIRYLYALLSFMLRSVWVVSTRLLSGSYGDLFPKGAITAQLWKYIFRRALDGKARLGHLQRLLARHRDRAEDRLEKALRSIRASDDGAVDLRRSRGPHTCHSLIRAHAALRAVP